MAKFLLITRGGTMPESPEEGARVMKAWTDWFSAIGASIVDPGSPISQVQIISADRIGPSRRRPVHHRLHRRRGCGHRRGAWHWRRAPPSTAT